MPLHLSACLHPHRATLKRANPNRMDWGFMVFGNDIEDAAAVFDSVISRHLLDGRSALSTAGSGGPTGLPRSGSGSGAAGGGGGALTGLAGAFGRLGGLLHRAQSEPGEMAVAVPSTLTISAAARAGGSAANAPGGTSVSEPPSPMLGALQAARSNFFQQAGAVSGAAGGAGAAGSGAGAAGGGAAGAVAAGGGGVAAAAVAAVAGAVKEQLPDDIRTAPGAHKGMHESEHYRVPSFQTGMKPW